MAKRVKAFCVDSSDGNNGVTNGVTFFSNGYSNYYFHRYNAVTDY